MEQLPDINGAGGLDKIEQQPDLNGSSQSLPWTQDTQEVDQPLSQMTIEEENYLGILIPDTKDFPIYFLPDLDSQSYSFGRSPQSNFIFDKAQFEKGLLAISKTHFSLHRGLVGSGSTKEVYLKDLSSNGTFINGREVGRDQQSVVRRNDRITLANKNANTNTNLMCLKKKGFVFFDNLKTPEWPDQLSKKYIMTKKIGKGAYGEVRLAFSQEKGSRESFAVKILKMKFFPTTAPILNKKHQQQIETEIQLMKSVQHPFIIRLEDVIDDSEFPEKIYLVMELADGGDFFDRVSLNTRLPEHTVKFYFYQLALAIQYLHDKGIIHRDIKPENILLETNEEETRLKLTDFGMSKLAADTTKMTTMCGTKTYMAPELIMLSSTNSYNKKVDIWSMGVFLFVSLGGYPPFWTTQKKTMEDRIINGDFDFKHPEKIWDLISNEGKDLISKLIEKDPAKRLDINETLNHPWLQEPKMRAKVNKLLEKEENVCSPNRSKRKIDTELEEENDILRYAKTLRFVKLAPGSFQFDNRGVLNEPFLRSTF